MTQNTSEIKAVIINQLKMPIQTRQNAVDPINARSLPL
jgi:hypothetical protein